MRILLLAAGVALAVSFPAKAQTQYFDAVIGKLAVTTAVSGLQHPWSFAFLPDGRMLITERPGRMRIAADGKLSPPLDGVPPVFAVGQGGLLDVTLDRNFAQNKTIYFCFADPMEGGGRTALARAQLGETRLDNVQIIFRQEGPPAETSHFGCRIVQTPDNLLFLTLGDHAEHKIEAQNLENHIGKIVRIAPDGSVPKDNPFVSREGAKPEIWSYGHRNIQAAALHPETGQLWEAEHGPRGGDEVNAVERGANYGWPVIGYGVGYDGAKLHESTRQEGMLQPLKHWTPSIAPSGMAFYSGELFPKWRGHLFVGALAHRQLVRVTIPFSKIGAEERLLRGLNERIRDVRVGPDGAIYVATDSVSGRILRIAPLNRPPQ